MNFSFESIKAYLNGLLSSLNNFKSVFFHSAYQRIVDLIAYIEEKRAYVAEYYYREASWQNAQNRSSLLTRAYYSQYQAHRKRGAIGAVQVSGDSTFSTSYIYPGNTVIIPKYTQFRDNSGQRIVYSTEEVTYYKNFVGPISIPVREGIPKEYLYTSKGVDNETITIFSDTTDNDIVEIDVVDSNGVVLNPVNKTTQPFFVNDLVNYYAQVQNAKDFSSIKIVFGDGNYTRALTPNQIIRTKYADTNGASGNIEGRAVISKFLSEVDDTQGNITSLFVTNQEPISDGQDYETITSIREQGRRLFFAGYRGASPEDWLAIIKTYPPVLKAKVYTSADLELPAVGFDQDNVYISIVSQSGDELTTDQQTELRENYLIPKIDPTDIAVIQPLQKIFTKFDVNALIQKVPITQVENEIDNALSAKYSILNTEFGESIYDSNYTSIIDMLDDVIKHETIGYYVEATDDADEPFNFTKYNYTLRPTKSGSNYYPTNSPFYEPILNKQILLSDSQFEIWIRRKVGGAWQFPTRIAKSTSSTIAGIKYSAIVNTHNATVNPTVTDDSSAGFLVGNIWKNTVTNTYYECYDNTIGAAVWTNIQLNTSGVPTVNTDNTLGYTVGSVIYQGQLGNYYECLNNATGGAVWKIRDNIKGFGIGSTSDVTTYNGYTWTISNSLINYTTNVLSYEVSNLLNDPDVVTNWGVLNPNEAQPLGYLFYLVYRTEDGNGEQNTDLRIGQFYQIFDVLEFMNTFAFTY